MNDSLKVTDDAAQAVAVAPRVKLADIEAAIAERQDFTAAKAIDAIRGDGGVHAMNSPLAILSICILRMQNGFVVLGKSAPASPANFDRELGRRFAYEDAVRQLWPLMGFALRDRLARDAEACAERPDYRPPALDPPAADRRMD